MNLSRPLYYIIAMLTAYHALVCDGYQESINLQLIHLNYGFEGGFSNGWYSLDNIGGAVDEYDVLFKNIFPAPSLNKEEQEILQTKKDEITLSTHPNPFNPSTRITYSLPIKGEILLKIYNVLGREVTELVNEAKEAGTYSLEFNGSQLASGLYILSMKVNDMENGQTITKSQKLLLTK